MSQEPESENESSLENSQPVGSTERIGLPAEDIGLLSSFKIRNFRFLITGTVLSNAAQFIQQVTLNWLVYNLTGSGAMLAYVNAARSAGSLGMVPAAGVLIDRFDRRKLMLTTSGWLFTISLILGLLLVTGPPRLYYLFVISFLGGLVQTVDATLRQVVIFNLVPRALTPNALALIQTGWGLMRSIGPAIGGFLLLWFGPGGNFLIQAGAYALVALSILQIRFGRSKTETVRRSAIQNIREGVAFVASQRNTRTFMMMGFMLPLLIVPVFTVLTPIYAEDVFHGGPDTLGLLMAFTGVGGIFGGIFTASLNRVERRGILQLGAIFLLGVSLIVFALMKELWQALALLVVVGFFEMIFLATNQALLQLSIPDHLRGRVTSIVNLNAALLPLGGLVAGFGADLLGGPQTMTFVLGGVSAAIAMGVFLFQPLVRNYRLSQGILQHSAGAGSQDKTQEQK